MLDLRLIRNEPDLVRAGLARRGEDTSVLDEVIALDAEHRSLTARRDGLRAEIRTISNQVGALHREQRADEAGALQEASRALGAEE
jgi:seryl-tRNA synthetase